jgi:hypothetical protein
VNPGTRRPEMKDEKVVKKSATPEPAPLDSEKLTDADLENVSGGASATCECHTQGNCTTVNCPEHNKF